MFAIAVSVSAAREPARAGDDPALSPDPGPAAAPDAPPPAPAPDATSGVIPPAPAPDVASEVIEVTGSTPAAGTITLDAAAARRAPGALGEPLRALALLPGVTTSIAASGYPIIRGTLPGESRFTYDGIELPMLYHFAIANQVIHPSFIGDLSLRAGGHGAEQGNLIGGLVAMTPAPAPDGTRTELRVNPIEVGVYRAQTLSKSTWVAAAARVGTLGLVKFFKPDYDLYYLDQQTRLVHRLGNGDQLTLTSLAAFDYFGRPDSHVILQADKLGFHRLDARWTRARADWTLRAGVETQIDSLRSKTVYEPEPPVPTHFEGGASYGARGYADASASVTPWLTTRGGVEARHRILDNGNSPFDLVTNQRPDPYLAQASRVDAAGAWAAVDLRIANVTITPGIRGDVYRSELYRASARHTTVDPRLAVTADLPAGIRAEISAGQYSAPPQASVFEHDMIIGPLPMTDGLGSAAGMTHAVEAEASLRAPLGAGLEASTAVYYRDTHRAIDFGVVGQTFYEAVLCSNFPARYRDLEGRAFGAELMVRGDLTRSATGWLSYSLARNDRDFGFLELPGDYDQRHTVNATAQWRRGRWLLGATGHLHTGRALLYPGGKDCHGNGVPETSADLLRRAPVTGRIDLRAERAFAFTRWRMSVYAEIQNATLTKEVVNYQVYGNVVGVHEVWLPLAVIGLEAVL